MNLGDEGHSPWGDERSNSPHPSLASNGHKQDIEEPQPGVSLASSQSPTTSTPSAVVKAPGGRGQRGARRFGTQTKQLEAIDDSLGPLGPLGPLGDSFQGQGQDIEEPPALPQKEVTTGRTWKPAASASPRPGSRSAGVDEDESQGPKLRQSNEQDARSRQTQPSANLDQASRPTFHITVSDPHKVGDLTSSHTVYQVRTKTTSKAYRQPEFEVSRRYRDFLWLYNQLHANNPGLVVPPPPDKQAVGRFDNDFVEARRAALERMLNKTASHVVLQHDNDLKLFLESESFNSDVKHRDRKDPDMPESKGMFSGLSLSVGSGTKFIEHDDWFLERRVYLDTMETSLKGLQKAIEVAIAQRRNLSEACSELSTSLNSLSQVELSPSLSGPLASLSDLHIRIRDLYARQAQQDILTLGIVIDEYIRLIGSIKKAFEQRQRSWQLWHNAESDLQKRRSALDKLHRQGRSQQDRITQLQADVGDAERRAHQAKLTFEELGKGMRAELERFENEKVEDFRMGVETYLESAVEAQKELIELWETYLMHLDADAEEQEAADEAKKAAMAASSAQPSSHANDSDTGDRSLGQNAGQMQSQTNVDASLDPSTTPSTSQVDE